MAKKHTEEILCWAREKYASAPESEKANWEYMFPELKESEDERIRKYLIRTMRQKDQNVPMVQKAISYLEKQNEQPTNEEMLRTLRVEYEKGVADTIAKYEQKPNPYIGTGFDYNGHHWGMCARDGGIEIIVDGKIRDRVSFESENIEWSNSLAKEMFIKVLERAVEQTKKGYELTDCDKHSWWEDFKAYSGIKPAEWSEDFEDNIRNLLHDKLTGHSEDGSMSWAISIDDKTLKDIVNGIWFYVGKEALKYPNKELSQPEWSEEDEIRLKEALEVLDESIKHLPLGYGYTKDVMYVKDWLKSLCPQPHWKPSEEQMEALLKLEETYVLEHERTPETAHLYMIIKSLREQLLKLKR